MVVVVIVVVIVIVVVVVAAVVTVVFGVAVVWYVVICVVAVVVLSVVLVLVFVIGAVVVKEVVVVVVFFSFSFYSFAPFRWELQLHLHWLRLLRAHAPVPFAVQPCAQGVIAGSLYIRRPQATATNAITSFNASRHILSNQQKWPTLGYLDHAWSILRSDT